MPLQDDLRDILRETFEGGQPGQPTMMLDGTRADGSGNHGIFATLAALNAEQASDATLLGTSAAAHTAHLAYYLEVGLLFMRGETPDGKLDWAGSFSPGSVDRAEWVSLQARLRAAYDEVMERVGHGEPLAVDELTNPVVHSAYHLGALRQLIKLV
jgi:hypothetical protein